MYHQNKPVEWLKLISLKYKSTYSVPQEKFDELITVISNLIDEKISVFENDYTFPVRIENIDCMCAIVLLTKNPITECQFVVMTKDCKRPSTLTSLEPIHQSIENLFLK